MESFKKSSSISFMFLQIIFYCCLLIKDTVANNFQCEPLNTNSCPHGGQCTSITAFYFELGNIVDFLPNEYRCRCPKINCYEEGGYNPVCGFDGTSFKSYYNDLCRRLTECNQQQSIEVQCDGMCGSSECRENPRVESSRCPTQNYCFNFGECLLSESNTKYCRCREGFFGPRCGSKSILEAVLEVEAQIQ